jgi:hypothetical protein
MSMNRFSTQLSIPHAYPQVFQACVQVVANSRFRISTADPERGKIFASRGMSWLSYGEDLAIQVWQQAPDAPCGLEITSTLIYGLVDWGRNRKNVEAIVAALPSLLER